MHILVLGAAGMIGRKYVESLLRDGRVGRDAVSKLTLHDVVAATPPASSIPTTVLASDFAADGTAKQLINEKPDLIIHLAAIVSGEAEQDFDKGYRINLDGTRDLFEAIRHVGGGYKPRVVFASSIAVFGSPFPDTIPDEFFHQPLTSYGTQKAISELLLADYARRGIFDGIGLRFPTVVVRPGAPNKAASGFFSNIIREPLAGKEAVLPVGDDVRHWLASPRSAVGFIRHAATLDLEKVGPRRNLSMPGLSATIAEMLDGLRTVGGEKALRLVKREPDAFIQKIVSGWATRFDARRAESLGFTAEKDFVSIVKAHVDDELGGTIG
jgi:D-erythronate 2-dehydrogenase